MFSKAAIIFSTLVLTASARTVPQCNTGALQCCNSVHSADDESIAGILALVGAVVNDVTAQVGVACNPISVIGAGGNGCTAQPVCCTDNSFNGLVALGCTPINGNV